MTDEAKLSNQDGTEGITHNIEFVLESLVQEFPELKGATKLTEPLNTYQSTLHGKDYNQFRNSVGCLAFSSVFRNN